MKVIFLDIDGVLNSYDNMQSLTFIERDFGILKARDEFGHLFDMRCVNNLWYLVKKTNAKIVLCSSWRFSFKTKSSLLRFQERRNLFRVIGKTGNSLGSRGAEIQYWLEKTKYKIESYVILDDDLNIFPEQKSYFVHCNGEFGLSTTNVQDALKILGEK